MQQLSPSSEHDLQVSLQGGKPQYVYFHLLLESSDLDIIKVLNKRVFANRAD